MSDTRDAHSLTKTKVFKKSELNEYRIVTLSPHLTELVFSLGLGEKIVAVSDYSDYPAKAASLPSVASYQGANISEIIRLKPTHVLAWKGGNKDTDIQLLKNNKWMLYESNINNIDDLKRDIQKIGKFLNVIDSADALVQNIQHKLSNSSFKSPPLNSIYYINSQPLIGLGNDEWINNLLLICNINNLYRESRSAYPQLKKADVIRKQPDFIIFATNQSLEQAYKYWEPHRNQLKSTLLKVNPDAMHRFTPRAIDETLKLCKAIKQSK